MIAKKKSIFCRQCTYTERQEHHWKANEQNQYVWHSQLPTQTKEYCLSLYLTNIC
jgi:hypothetical protein